jgi:hypothetical protein
MVVFPSVSFQYPNKVYWTQNLATSFLGFKKIIFLFRNSRYCSRYVLTLLYCNIVFVSLNELGLVWFFQLNFHQWRLFVVLLSFQALPIIESERTSVTNATPFSRSVYQYNNSKSWHLYWRVLNALLFAGKCIRAVCWYRGNIRLQG